MLEHQPNRLLALLAGIAPLALLASCGGAPTPKTVGHVTPVMVPELGQAGFTDDATQAYRIRSNDTISIAVFREPDLSVGALQVGPDGTVAMPLLGDIKIGGLTMKEAAASIEGRLQPGYLTDPKVSVNIVKYGSHQVSVEGAVTTAGRYEFTPGTHLSALIAQAGGITRISKLSEVVILRPDGQGMTIAKFDYRAINAGSMVDPVILPNDRIVVGTSGLAQGYQDFLRTVPVFALFLRYI